MLKSGKQEATKEQENPPPPQSNEAQQVIKILNTACSSNKNDAASSEDRSPRSESPLSGRSLHSSDEQIVTRKVSLNLCSYTIRELPSDASITARYDIAFVITTQRPETNLQGQGDHASSYVAIIQMLLSATNSSIRGSVASLENLMKEILAVEPGTSGSPTPPKVHTHEIRTTAVRDMEAGNTGIDNASLLNSELQYAKLARLAQYLSELTSYFLVSMQEKPLATFYSRGRVNKKPQEASLAKQASRALVMLEQFCEFSDMDNKAFETKLPHIIFGLSKRAPEETEDEHILKYGLKAWTGHDQQSEDLIKTLKNDEVPTLGKKAAIQKVKFECLREQEKIAAFWENLLDYQYQLIFRFEEAATLTDPENKAVKEGKKSLLKIKAEKMHVHFTAENHKIEFSSTKEKKATPEMITVTRNNVSELAEVVSNHLRVMSAAFPKIHLSLEKEHSGKEIMNIFLEKFITHQGWRDFSFRKGLGEEKKLDAAELSDLLLVESSRRSLQNLNFG